MRYSNLIGAAWLRPHRRPRGVAGLAARGVASAAGGRARAARPPGPHLDAARWSNIVALDGAYAAGKGRLAATPLEAYVEVSARCNLRCRMCAITVDPRYDPHSGNPPLLTSQLFDRLEPLIPTLQRVYLQGLGEPFLNRELTGFAERLAAAGVEVWITTNATLVREPQAEALALAGVTRITVSIDAATAATYERIRVRGNFEHTLRGIRALGAARRRHGRPKLFLSLIAMASNLAELPRVVELCAEVGGDGVFVESLYGFPGLEEFTRQEVLHQLEPGRIEELLEAARSRAASLGIELVSRLDELALFSASVGGPAPPATARQGAAAHAGPDGLEGQDAREEPDARERQDAREVQEAPNAGDEAKPAPAAGAAGAPLALPWACSEPWATINVNASGDVRTCCFNNQVFGNLARQPFDEIWNGEAYQEMRADHIAGRVPASCSTCVRHGRVKRSGFLAPRRPQEGAAHQPAGRARLLAPADGELIAGPLVVVGQLPPRLPQPTPELPELCINGVLLVRLRDFAVIDGDRFAAAIAIPWVTTGAYVLSLSPAGPSGEAAGEAELPAPPEAELPAPPEAELPAPPEAEAPAPPEAEGTGAPGAAGPVPPPAGHDLSWEHRRLQIGTLGGEAADLARYPPHQIPPAPATLTAVTRLAFALRLACQEPAPSLRLGGRRHPIAAWFCGPHAMGWMGVAVVDVHALAPGSYPLELRLRRHPPFQRRLVRLSSHA
jgi:MoaA/NifB/PqqE/SkfB family radical SAM enzyme